MMAQLPPRRSIINSSCKTSCHRTTSLSALQILQQMGFTKSRAEKALAATGHRGPQLAADWLLAHVNDPTLDDYSPREYILYLCPSGPLQSEIETFYSKSLDKCGWNAAHNYIPHVTLCSFFQAPDECVELLVNALVHCTEKMGQDLPKKISLTPHISQNFIGLFIGEDENDAWRRFAMMFMRECAEFVGSETGPLHAISTCFPWCSSYPLLNPRKVEVEPYLKNLHITLSYQYAERDREYLSSLLKELNTEARCNWQLRLYSRDSRIKGNEVYRVLYPHVPRQPDELELLIDDYVYVNADALKSSIDGWVEGISWLTGCHGVLPINYIERTAESDAWTLHKCILLGDDDNPDSLNGDVCSVNRINKKSYPISGTAPAGGTVAGNSAAPPSGYCDSNNTSSNCRTGVVNANDTNSEPDLKIDEQQQNNCSMDPEKVINKDCRRLITVRHGERMDFAFGKWIEACFDDKERYSPKDLNHPRHLPKRDSPWAYQNDTSLTVIGEYQGFLVGRAIADVNLNIHHVYCSPAFRCVQTCHNILKGAGIVDKISINIEPGLFEFIGWHAMKMPTWMAPQELANNGFRINLNYRPLITVEEINGVHKSENILKYYERSHLVTEKILNATEGNVLFVGHAATLDSCTRIITGKPIPEKTDFHRFLELVPYCAHSLLQKDATGPWKLVEPLFPGIAVSLNRRYDFTRTFQALPT